jgi:hypothetical protein
MTVMPLGVFQANHEFNRYINDYVEPEAVRDSHWSWKLKKEFEGKAPKPGDRMLVMTTNFAYYTRRLLETIPADVRLWACKKCFMRRLCNNNAGPTQCNNTELPQPCKGRMVNMHEQAETIAHGFARGPENFYPRLSGLADISSFVMDLRKAWDPLPYNNVIGMFKDAKYVPPSSTT